MRRQRVFVFFSLPVVCILANVSWVFSETVPAEKNSFPNLQPFTLQRELPAVSVEPARSPDAKVPWIQETPATESQQDRSMVIMEGSRGLSLDRLRREQALYPDQSLLERFVEASTERPPLFGSD